MPVIKVTLASGHEHEFPFDIGSTLTVESNLNDGPSQTKREQRSWGEVIDIQLVDGTLTESPDTPDETTPMLTSPGVAIEHAKTLPLADAGAHIEKAIAKFGEDDDLLEVQTDISDAVRSGAETFETAVVGAPAVEAEPEAQTGTAEATTDEATTDEAKPELETPEAALAHLESGLSVEEADAHVTAALAKFPDDEDLLAAKVELDAMLGRPPVEPEQS